MTAVDNFKCRVTSKHSRVYSIDLTDYNDDDNDDSCNDDEEKTDGGDDAL